MRLVLTGRHVEITPALRRTVEQKLSKLSRVLNDSLVSVQVVLTREKYRHVAEMTLHARGDHMLHGIGESSGWAASLAAAVEKLDQQAHTVKGKWQTRKRRATPSKTIAARQPVLPPGEEAPRAPRIVRTARYPVKPMTVEEAALEVGAGADAVLVFRNATTDSINVLYRRKDGDLGLIEPEA